MSVLACQSLDYRQHQVLTYDQALHLVFPYDFYIQRLLYLVVVLERTTTSRHDAQVWRFRSIVLLLVGLQLAHKLYTRIYPISLKLEEVQTSASRVVTEFAREVYKFGQGASNLRGRAAR
jgi:hypothetical protein